MISADARAIQRILRDEILKNGGAIDIGHFMGCVLGHPQHGYYMRRDPFGMAGDFTTAPEISQMFGEMIGAWLVDVWIQMGAFSPFILLEAGPGRGTLMADILRVSGAFREAARIHFLETSPVLRQRQSDTLSGMHDDIQWHAGLDTVPNDLPIFFVANEFFDALPIQQYVYSAVSGWRENMVRYDAQYAGAHNPGFYIEGQDWGGDDPLLVVHCGSPKSGDIIEVSNDRSVFMHDLARRIAAQGGAGIIIDYGHTRSGYGDTFQALHKHQKVGVLDYIGDADLTSHVDFAVLRDRAQEGGAKICGLTSQGAFLKNLGIDLRAQQLIQNAQCAQTARDIQNALHRLTHSDEMGSLFKVMGIYSHDTKINAAGF